MKNPVPRVAAINDLSGFGRSSLTAIIPVLSTMGMQVCPLPTAVLSTHTGGFENYVFVDFTSWMRDFMDHWKSLEIEFDAIYSGFFGSAEQGSIVEEFIQRFKREDQIVLVDPVLADDGKLYDTIGDDIVQAMRKLVRSADVITPNFTEACFLLDRSYTETIDEKGIKDCVRDLSEMGPKIVIVTSAPVGFPGGGAAYTPSGYTKHFTFVVAYDREDGRFWKLRCDYVPAYYPGTGDIFSSVILGSLLQGDSLPIAMDRAAQFVLTAIRSSFGYNLPKRDGVLLERVLNYLSAPVPAGAYEILE
ncbi:MAG TPA: pyridoxamine kinase [Spirochaetia bacterium]|nr:pyridoxamine kinase [Spirochaetia bacterium]